MEGNISWDNLVLNSLDVSNHNFFFSANRVHDFPPSLFLDLSIWKDFNVRNGVHCWFDGVHLHLHLSHHLFQKVFLINNAVGVGVVLFGKGGGPVIVEVKGVSWGIGVGEESIVFLNSWITSFGGVDWAMLGALNLEHLDLWNNVFVEEDWISKVHLEGWHRPEFLEY